MTWSRILAALIVVAATLWIGSGVLGRTGKPAAETSEAAVPAKPLFRVSVRKVVAEMHARSAILSGRTEADKQASAVSRTAGSIVELKVRRGSRVEQGDVVAVLSDEAREAQVAQGEALVEQRRVDLNTKLALIKRGIVAANEQNQLEADLLAAEAALAQASAERERAQVRAPIAGVVSEVPVTTGQALQPNMMVAKIVGLDPMLAVVEVAERQLGGVHVGDRATVEIVTGQRAEGVIRFISPTASPGTRTYRIDIEIENKAGSIPDGVTCQVALAMRSVQAARIPRSALTFSSEGQLSLRAVTDSGVVESVPIKIVEDAQNELWVSGPTSGQRIIVQGQDFVTDGQRVEAVEGAPPSVVSRN